MKIKVTAIAIASIASMLCVLQEGSGQRGWSYVSNAEEISGASGLCQKCFFDAAGNPLANGVCPGAPAAPTCTQLWAQAPHGGLMWNGCLGQTSGCSNPVGGFNECEWCRAVWCGWGGAGRCGVKQTDTCTANIHGKCNGTTGIVNGAGACKNDCS